MCLRRDFLGRFGSELTIGLRPKRLQFRLNLPLPLHLGQQRCALGRESGVLQLQLPDPFLHLTTLCSRVHPQEATHYRLRPALGSRLGGPESSSISGLERVRSNLYI